jgi:hypothetical protein
MANGYRSSTTGLQPSWMRWLLPSIADLFFVALLAVLVFTNLSVRLLGDAGIGWHIRTGQLILQTHSIPHVDPFSSSMSGQPWFAWEWLYDVIVGWLASVAGLNGVVLLTALLIATVFSFTFRMLLRRGCDVLTASVLVLLTASAAMIHFLARPHVVSWLFTMVWFWILQSAENGRSGSEHKVSGPDTFSHRKLWLLPLTMLLWVNLHGGFLVGFVLLAIYWISAAWSWLRLRVARLEDAVEKIRAGHRVRTLTWTGILSVVATLLNPYGFHLQAHIYEYLSNHFLMNHIDEFQSPNFHYVAQKCFAALLLLTLIALASKKSRVQASQLLVLLFAVYSGLYAARNIPVSSLLLVAIIAPWISDEMARLTESRSNVIRSGSVRAKEFLARMKSIELGLRGHLWPVVTIVLTCWIAAHAGKLGSDTAMDAHFDAKRFPMAAVDYLETHDVRGGPLLSPDSWGGYLIYRFYPQEKVILDDRHDLYGEEFLKSYLKLLHAEPGWEEFLLQHPANCAIVPKDSALANLFTGMPGWHKIYSDDVALAFVRDPVASR